MRDRERNPGEAASNVYLHKSILFKIVWVLIAYAQDVVAAITLEMVMGIARWDFEAEGVGYAYIRYRTTSVTATT